MTIKWLVLPPGFLGWLLFQTFMSHRTKNSKVWWQCVQIFSLRMTITMEDYNMIAGTFYWFFFGHITVRGSEFSVQMCLCLLVVEAMSPGSLTTRALIESSYLRPSSLYHLILTQTCLSAGKLMLEEFETIWRKNSINGTSPTNYNLNQSSSDYPLERQEDGIQNSHLFSLKFSSQKVNLLSTYGTSKS